MSKVSICCTAPPWMDLETSICSACKDHTTFIDDDLHYIRLGIAWYNRETKVQEWALTSHDHEDAVTVLVEEFEKPADIGYNKLKHIAQGAFPGGFDSMKHNIVHVWIEDEL